MLRQVEYFSHYRSRVGVTSFDRMFPIFHGYTSAGVKLLATQCDKPICTGAVLYHGYRQIHSDELIDFRFAISRLRVSTDWLPTAYPRRSNCFGLHDVWWLETRCRSSAYYKPYTLLLMLEVKKFTAEVVLTDSTAL